MGFDIVSSVLDIGKSLIERLIPDPAQKAAAFEKLAELQQNGELAQLAAETDLAKAQIDVNKVEAASPLTFISGARPFVIWVCAAGLAVAYVIGPLIAWGGALVGRVIPIPAIQMDSLLTVMVPILGIQTAARTIEKIKGVASK
jgi:hypothetical protein